MRLVEIRQIQHHSRYKSTLHHPKQNSRYEEPGPAAQGKLTRRNNRPDDHLQGDPSVWPEPFADELGGDFGEEEG